MAAVTHLGATADTSNAASSTSGSFTPAIDDLLVVYVATVASAAATTTVTDSQGGVYTQVGRALKATSADTLYCFVRNTLCESAAARTFTWVSSDAPTNVVISIAKVTGMQRAGSTAIRQSDPTDNGAAAGTPATVFSGVALTGNACIFGMFNATNPATQTAPASFVERVDTGSATPAMGFQYSSRDSGHTSATITQGGTSATAFGAFAVELDATAWPTPVPDLLNMAPMMR